MQPANSRPITSSPDRSTHSRGTGPASRNRTHHGEGTRHPTATMQPLDVMPSHSNAPKTSYTRFPPPRALQCSGAEVRPRPGNIPPRLLSHGLTPGTKPPVLGARRHQLRSRSPRTPTSLATPRQPNRHRRHTTAGTRGNALPGQTHGSPAATNRSKLATLPR
jgi:hypothetical protein